MGLWKWLTKPPEQDKNEKAVYEHIYAAQRLRQENSKVLDAAQRITAGLQRDILK